MGQYGSYKGAPGGTNTDGSPSGVIFQELDALRERDGRAYGVFDDFVCSHDLATSSAITKIGDWVGIADSAGSLAGAVDILGGAQNLVTGATQDVDLVMQYSQGAPFVIGSSAANGKLLGFEARFKISSIGNVASFFIGLTEQDRCVNTGVLATAGNNVASIDAIGFYRPEADGDGLDFIYRKAGQTLNTKIADCATLVADTFIQVGFLFDQDTSDNAIQVFVDGADNATKIPASVLDDSDFPDGEELTVTMAAMNHDGSTDVTLTVDWIKCLQAR